jgi:hypothetical protein
VILLKLKLVVDGNEVPVNEFVERILIGSIVGGVTTLRGIKEDWTSIKLEILK